MRFAGMPYPIQPHARGYFHVQQGTAQIKSDMLALLLTHPGERVMLPGFGTGLNDFLFEPADSFTVESVRTRIAQQLTAWEPRVVIQDIQIQLTPNEDDLDVADDLTQRESILLIRISFLDPENIKEIKELLLEVPLAGG